MERPRSFAALPGGISQPGPMRLVIGAVVIGAVLILGGARTGRSRGRSAAEAARRPQQGHRGCLRSSGEGAAVR